MEYVYKLETIKKRAYLFMYFILFLVLVAPTNCYASEVKIIRLSGTDRYETASSIALEGWGASEYAILVSGENFPDSLTATPLAYYHNAPILLTEKDTLNSYTAKTLESLKVSKVIIIGGSGAISQAVEDKLYSLGYVTARIAGIDRYDTSVKVAEELDKELDIKEIVFVPGDQYAYALAISPIAAKRKMPIILLPQDNIPESVQGFLRKTAINKTYIVGYESNISSDVVDLMRSPEKIRGTDVYDTCLKVIQRFRENYYVTNTIMATGTNFADALAGAAFAAKFSAPIILTGETINLGLQGWIKNKEQNINKFYALGGEGVLPSSFLKSYLVTSEDTDNGMVQVDNNLLSFRYSKSWERKAYLENDLVQYALVNSNISSNIILIRFSTLQTSMPLEDYYSNTLSKSNTISNADKEYFTIDGVKTMSWNIFKNNFTQREVRIIKDNKLYSITYVAENSSFANNLDDLESVFNSIKFK